MAVINVKVIEEFNTDFNNKKLKINNSVDEVINIYRNMVNQNILSSAEVDTIITELNGRIKEFNESFSAVAQDFNTKIEEAKDQAEQLQKSSETTMES